MPCKTAHGESRQGMQLEEIGLSQVLDISQCRAPCEHHICYRHKIQVPQTARGMHAQACAAAPAMLAAAPASRARQRARASRWHRATAPRARSRLGPAMATAWCGLAAAGVGISLDLRVKPCTILLKYQLSDVPLHAPSYDNQVQSQCCTASTYSACRTGQRPHARRLPEVKAA